MKKLNGWFATVGIAGALAVAPVLTIGAGTAAAATRPPIVAPITVPPIVIEPQDRCSGGFGGGLRGLPACLIA